MRITIAVSAMALAVLTGCNANDDDAGPTEPTSSASASASASTSPSTDPSAPAPDDAASLVGDWHDPEAEWVVHFHDDGTFTEDYLGVKDFRTGDYQVDGDTVTITGGDGESSDGTIEGDSLVFRLGTLTRM